MRKDSKKKTIYHGSAGIIETPTFGKGNVNNDYGLGFYCTYDPELAKEWAVGKGRDGYANRYSISEEELSILNLGDGNYNILNWLSVLVDNRIFKVKSEVAMDARNYLLGNFLPDYHKYDVIRGYRADDSYFAFANDFLNNVITLEKLNYAMSLGNLGEQYVLMSQRAFDNLSFEGWELASNEIYFPRKEKRDWEARESYFKYRTLSTEGHYMIDILREKWRNDDERIQRIIY
ncbi:MAG: DUF3990 domain-containing protein [Lachnospiraceae bacterium]|nr:DUF3990 domain-containing protein [Lachnospiraceae bacterium]